NSSRQRLYQAAVRARQIFAMEDRASGDDQGRAGVVDRAYVVVVDAAVDLEVNRLRQELARALDPVERVGHELLAGVARVDAHAEHEVRVAGDLGDVLGLRLGIEGDADLEAVLPRGGDRPWYVLDC